MPNNTQQQLDDLKQKLESLTAEYYSNNFSSVQDFKKYSRFNTRIKFPTYASAPTTCEVGEAYVNTGNGKLYICSAANTWTAQT